MLNIVTGKINSGKTTRLLNIYKTTGSGDGFISIKNMRGSLVHSYDILRLSNHYKRQFVVHDQFLDRKLDIACQIGPYMFLEDTLDYIYDEYRKMIKQGISPLYIDEIGMLELHDQAFHQIFKELLESHLTIYAVIRKDLIEDVLKKYSIKEYTIIQS